MKSLEGISITKVSSPKEVTKGKSFAAPFVFAAAKADGSPAEGLSLTISYPASKSEGKINYEKAEAITDAEGKISFEAAQTSFAAASKVSVYPTPVTEDKELAEELKKVFPCSIGTKWKDYYNNYLLALSASSSCLCC